MDMGGLHYIVFCGLYSQGFVLRFCSCHIDQNKFLLALFCSK